MGARRVGGCIAVAPLACSVVRFEVQTGVQSGILSDCGCVCMDSGSAMSAPCMRPVSVGAMCLAALWSCDCAQVLRHLLHSTCVCQTCLVLLGRS
jgi:hypothetical protein